MVSRTLCPLDSHGYQPLSRSVIQAIEAIDSCIVLSGNMSVSLYGTHLTVQTTYIPFIQSQNHMMTLVVT